ncbi:60S ribosomal protein L36 [Myotis davidii]|uniref:Large ribosomal subunit protein eL36 n=1 Tax=Myotis davidii TaxID=225400 RepID=L5LMK7_MYODS|nr:60S ribosomal protein L36 [Myotis davidii]
MGLLQDLQELLSGLFSQSCPNHRVQSFYFLIKMLLDSVEDVHAVLAVDHGHCQATLAKAASVPDPVQAAIGSALPHGHGPQQGPQATKDVRKLRHPRCSGRLTKCIKLVQDMIREVCGSALYERSTMRYSRSLRTRGP